MSDQPTSTGDNEATTTAHRPRIGITLPTFGPHAGPEAIATIARAADRLGFDTLVATERLLLPAHEGWENDFGLPEWYVWEPIEVLTWAAALTERIRLATGIVNALFQPAVILARRLATLDRLSGGRLDVGLGQGWLPEEFVATGVSPALRGQGFEDHIAAIRACWGPDPVAFEAPGQHIPPTTIGPKPVRGADIPLALGAVARPAVERAARVGAGFVTGVRDWKASAAEIGWYRDAGGRGDVIVQVMSSWGADANDPPSTFASWAVTEVEHAAGVGADEIRFELNLTGVAIDRQVAALEALSAALPDRRGAPVG